MTFPSTLDGRSEIEILRAEVAELRAELERVKATPKAQERDEDKDLPEWYHMAREFFREIAVFSSSMYLDMHGENILIQLRYAAQREVALQSGGE